LDIERIRQDFPIFALRPYGKPLAYLDNAATSQKPRAVIDAIEEFYCFRNSNVHRGVHYLGQAASEAYEGARETLQRFLGARAPGEIVFTRSATEAINLVAQTYGRRHVREGDEVLVSVMEHHSNWVPWQMLCEERGAALRVIPMTDAGEFDLTDLEGLLTEKTRLVAATHVSNVLGTVNPVRRVADAAHAVGAAVLVDGAQSAPHLPIDVGELRCDFFACSGHKMLGPTGVGVLYGRGELLDAMPPWQGGGEMIESVSLTKTTFREPPARFEAGTPPIAGAIGLAAAVDYLESVGRAEAAAYEGELLAYGTALLDDLEGIRLVGAARERVGVMSFVVEGVHPHDVAQVVDGEGVAIRGGHHCAQPLMERLGIPGTARASLAFYNTRADLDALAGALVRVREMFG